MEMLILITNKHAPLKQLSRRQMKLQRKPWITKGDLHVDLSQATNIQIIFLIW